MIDSLRSRTLHGLFWSFFERFGTQLVQFVISIVLARLLMPEQFGLIGMLSLFIAVAQSLLDSGFGSALIQKQDVTPLDESSVFYFNIVLSIGMAGLLALCAPLIARFYDEPTLVPLTRVLALNLPIGGLGLIQVTLIKKRLAFKSRARVVIAATLVSGTAGILCAIGGLGVWSLVVKSMTQTACQTLLFWRTSSWRPIRAFSLSSLRSMFGYGSRLLASGLLNTVFTNLYNLVIGRLFSSADLGFYTRAMSMQTLSVQSIGNTVSQVMFPSFATIQHDKMRLQSAYRRSLRMLSFVSFPLSVWLFVTAEPLVMVLLTAKWAAAVPYLRLLSVAGILYPLHVLNLNMLQVTGRSDLFLRLEVLKKVFIVAAIAITWRYGIEAMIYGQIVTSVISYGLNSHYSGRLIGYGTFQQLVDVLPIIGCCLAMGLVGELIGSWQVDYLASLVAIVLGCGAVYLGLCWILRIEGLMQAQELARQLRGTIEERVRA